MLLWKEFVIPLIPFFIDTLLRLRFLPSGDWWLRFDANTLLLTISLWAIFLLSKTPEEPPIPTDGSAKDALATLRFTFTGVVMVGFTMFGMVSLAKIALVRIPDENAFLNGELLSSLTIGSLVFCLMTLLLIWWKWGEIQKVSRV